jgi:hypothetical protein
MSAETYPRKFTQGEIVLIHGMVGEEAIHNGKEGVIERLAYIHPDNNRIVFNVRIPGAGLWALEPWNLKKTHMDPYDGNKIMTWDDPRCVWRPDPNFKKPLADDWDGRDI